MPYFMHWLAFLSYGYITNTKIKFIIIIESTNQQFHETEIKIVSTLAAHLGF